MIYEFNTDEYKNALPITKHYNIEIPAILSGNSFGKVFADSKTTPRTALVWTKDGVFFIGDANNDSFNSEISAFINERLLPINKKYNIKWLSICCVNNAWKNNILYLLKDRKLDTSNQLVYRMSINDYAAKPTAKADLKIVNIDNRLFEQNLINSDDVKKDIIDYWDSLDFFYKNGFGFAIVKGNRIISTCSVNFVYENTCTLGVWTDKAYHRQGYAKSVVSHMLNYLKDRNLEPYWDCMEKNSASRALAESLGFKLDYKYKLIEFKL